MSGLGEKDAFPTPEMKNEDGTTAVFAGPGLTVFEFACIELCKGILSGPLALTDEDEISNMAVTQAQSLIRRMEREEG